MTEVDSNEDLPVRRVLFGDLRPGETAIDDFDGLKVADISTLAELSHHEALNIADALVDYLRTSGRKVPIFDLEGVKEVHRDMFGNVWDWAGQFRQKDVNISFASKYASIQSQLYDLLEDMKGWEIENSDVFEIASRFHHRVVQIHPFPNGNGRWSRLLTNIWLINKHEGIIDWPSDIVSVSKIRGDYIDALKKADHGDPQDFVDIHQRHWKSLRLGN